MTGERVLSIRMRTIGQETVQRSIRGISASARQAQRTQERSSQQAAQASIRAERQATREAAQSARTRAQIAQREMRDRTRAAAQAQRQQTQAAARAAREQAAIDRQLTRDEARNAQEVFRTRQRLRQLDQRAQQQQRREADRQRTSRGSAERWVMGGAAGAASAVALSALNGALSSITQRLETITAAVGNRAGVMDEGQRTARAQDFELAMSRNAGEFFQGVTPEERARQMQDLTTEINGVALASGQSPTELLGVLETMQQQFSQFSIGRRDLAAIADEAQRTGADMNELATFIGNLNQQLGETAPTAERAFDIMAQGGLEGAITPGSFAENFGGMLGQFQTQTGLQGEDALRQFMALANISRTGAQSDAEAATQVHGLIAALGSPRARDHIREAMGGRRVGRGASAHFVGGSTAFRDDGTVDYAQLIQDMSAIENTSRGSGVAAALRQAGARDAMTSLTRAQRHETSGPDFATLVGVDADVARARRAEDIARVTDTSAFRARRIGVQGEINGIEGLSGRVGGAMDQLGFQEAVTQSGSGWFVDAINAVAPDIVTQRAVPALASFISGMSPEHRGTFERVAGAVGQAGMSMPVFGGAIGAAATGVNSAFGQLGAIGDRNASLADARATSRVRLEAGSAVDLNPATVDAIGRAVAASMPAAPAPSALGSGGASRTPRDRRPS